MYGWQVSGVARENEEAEAAILCCPGEGWRHVPTAILLDRLGKQAVSDN